MRVLLTRPAGQAEELGAVLAAQGVEWLGEPLLRIVPGRHGIPASSRARRRSCVTSANASRELLRVPGVRRDCPVFAVGPATAAPLQAAGFSDVQAAGGTAVSLIAHVRRHADPRAGRLLHVSGRDIALDLAAGLAPAGFAVDRVVVYRAVAVERLNAGVNARDRRGRIDAAVFLSARTAAVFCSLVIASGIVDACARMTAVAISRKVAQALQPAGFRQVVVAASPAGCCPRGHSASGSADARPQWLIPVDTGLRPILNRQCSQGCPGTRDRMATWFRTNSQRFTPDTDHHGGRRVPDRIRPPGRHRSRPG